MRQPRTRFKLLCSTTKSLSFISPAGGAPEVIPSTPIDAAITIKFQSELRTKFDAIRYVTSIRRPEDILDTAAVWGYAYFIARMGCGALGEKVYKFFIFTFVQRFC